MNRTGRFNGFGVRTRKGFTLAEILVAMLIFTVGTVSIVSSLRFAIRTAAVSDDLTTALAAARREAEELYSKGFDDAALDEGSHTLIRPNYTATYQVAILSPTLKQVELTLNHRGYTGENRQVQIVTHLAEAMR